VLGQKHLVKCRCVLPQFKRFASPPVHQFTVFSVINDDNSVKPKFAQCTNCGVIHKVIELGRSEIMQGKEAMSSIVTIDDIKLSLNPKFVSVLEGNNADLPTWEATKFIIDNKQWGQYVVLTSDVEDNIRQGKYMIVVSESMLSIDGYTRQEAPR